MIFSNDEQEVFKWFSIRTLLAIQNEIKIIFYLIRKFIEVINSNLSIELIKD
jgi:hypothetical protein